MSHQPFEAWILDNDTLPPADRRALQEHVAECAQCRKLQTRWQAVRMELRARPMAAPAPGFTQRWKAGLAERRAREQRKQAWKIFGLLVAGALFVSLLMGVYAMATSTPADWLTALVRSFSSSRDLIHLGIESVQAWLASTPLALNIALWIYLTVALCLLSLVWVLILWRTTIVGVLNQ